MLNEVKLFQKSGEGIKFFAIKVALNKKNLIFIRAMVNRTTAIIFFGVLLVLFSCKKENKATSPITESGSGAPWVNTSTARIKTEETRSRHQNSSTEYFYNSAGQLEKMLFDNGAYIAYEWKPGLVVETSLSWGNSAAQTTTYTLDAVGNATAYTNSTDLGFFEYTDGYLAHSSYSLQNFTFDQNFSFQNGNQIAGSDSQGNSYTYEYYSDKSSTISLINKGFTAFGKQNKHLIKKSVQTNFGTATETNYSYEFDSRNRVTKQIETTEVDTLTTTYTYY